MTQTFNAASGIVASVQLGAYTLCADGWDWNDEMNLIPTPSFCGGRYMEYAAGKLTGNFSITGTYNLGQNPFLLGFKTGSVVVSIFRINNAVVASCLTTIVQKWNVHSEADGTTRYTVDLVGDWLFNDFSNTAA